MTQTVAIALSGGIDSMVAAALLKEQGHPLTGLHFLTGYESLAMDANGAKPTGDHPAGDPIDPIRDRLDAMAEQLDIPIHIIDLRQEFKSIVVNYFIQTYRSGRTPNPCLVCNPLIKFDILYKKALSMGAASMATGHYARINLGSDKRMHLLRGVDPKKDQSYFLARLTQAQLGSTILPLGELTKTQTRQMARQRGLQPAAPQESQDICFIKDGKYSDFIEQQPGFTYQPGDIEDLKGQKIGRHAGLHRFTVGQRRGINCPACQPYYVHHIDMARNCLVVCFKKDLQVSDCRVDAISWIAPCPQKPIQVSVRLRYRHMAVAATLMPLNNQSAMLRFQVPQQAVTPGQGAVFYQKDEVLGGGWIE